MEKQKLTYEELKANGQLKEIPSHEIEKLFNISADAFDYRRRRGGYPDSPFYKEFLAEKAGEEKLMAERVSKRDLNQYFVFWRLSIPRPHLIIILLFGIPGVLSLLLCPIFLLILDDEYKGYCSLLIGISSIFISWITYKYRFFIKNPREYYEEEREKDFHEVSVLR